MHFKRPFVGLLVPIHLFYLLIIKYYSSRGGGGLGGGGWKQFKGTDEREIKHPAAKELEIADIPQDSSLCPSERQNSLCTTSAQENVLWREVLMNSQSSRKSSVSWNYILTIYTFFNPTEFSEEEGKVSSYSSCIQSRVRIGFSKWFSMICSLSNIHSRAVKWSHGLLWENEIPKWSTDKIMLVSEDTDSVQPHYSRKHINTVEQFER